MSPGDGRQLWSAPGPGADQEVANSPIVLPGDRVLLTYWPHSVMLQISKEAGGLQAREMWRATAPRASNGPTIHHNGVPDRFVERLKVQVFKPETRSVTGPSVSGDRVYVRNLGEIAAFAIEPR